MDAHASLVADLAVIMIVAGIATFIFSKLKQPLILGYLIAGIIIGPYTPPFGFIGNPGVISSAADLGVILLLFGIGLEFPLAKFKKTGIKVYISIALIEVVLMLVISFGLGQILRWPVMDCVFLGIALSSSSTVIIAKVLMEMGKLQDISALIMMGVLIAEDLIVVIMLTVITSVANIGTGFSLFPDMVWTIGKILLFIVGALTIGILLIPRIIDWMARPDAKKDDNLINNEVLLLVALGLCFGLSILSNLVGLSVAIGAFLMGIFIANSRSAGRVASLTFHIKDMFAAIFFVSMGAYIDVTQFKVFLLPALMITVMMVIVKVVGCGLGTKIFRYDTATALKVGLGMGQIGEFAFIVMKVAQDLNLISPHLFSVVGTAVAITAFTTPYLIRLSYKLAVRKPRAASE